MLRRLVLSIALASTAGACAPPSMMPCAGCPSNDDHTGEIVGGAVIAIGIAGLISLGLSMAELVMYMRARGHAG